MISKILNQCEKSITRFEKVFHTYDNVWVPRSILFSEGFLFCAICDLCDVGVILESGIYNAGSTFIWAKYFKKGVKAWDVHIRSEAIDRLKGYRKVELTRGDGRFGIKEFLNKNEYRNVGIFLDGPKGIEAVNWAKRFINDINVKFVGIHDCHRISYGKTNQTRIEMEKYQGLQFYSDYQPFIDEYSYLDKNIIGKRDEEQKISWYPYKIIDDRKVDRSLGSYGMTMGFLLKEV